MDRTLLGLVMMFLLGFTLFISFIALNRPLTGIISAYEDGAVSPIKSLVFAWPLTVTADGTEKAKVTVVARNTKGESLPGREVTITSSLGTVEPVAGADGDTQYVFYLSSAETGIAEIEAMVDNIKIQRKITVKFE